MKKDILNELREDYFWKLVELANWKKDGDYERIRKMFINLPEKEAFENFCCDKASLLADKFHDDWLGNPGIEVSDDGWSDLTAEVVGRGRKFYESITVKKLQKMAEDLDYNENFLYSFHWEHEEV